jgi:hypothetical protein
LVIYAVSPDRLKQDHEIAVAGDAEMSMTLPSALELLNVANELERLSGLPEHAWDDRDYAMQDACRVKLRRIESRQRSLDYKYDEAWLVDDADYIAALRERMS